MPNNPNNLVVLARARTFAVDLHRAVERRARRVGRASPGLRNQMLRASMSIALNIAEGAGKDTRAEFAVFVGHAIGSANEVEQQNCGLSLLHSEHYTQSVTSTLTTLH